MNTQLLYANSILLFPHLFMSPVNYLLSDSANKPTSNDEGASIVCLSNLLSLHAHGTGILTEAMSLRKRSTLHLSLICRVIIPFHCFRLRFQREAW